MERTTNVKKSYPLWRKTTPGTLILRNGLGRLKPKQVVRCTVEELGRFALHFEVLEAGTGKDKVTKDIIKKSVKKAEKLMIRKGDSKTERRVFTKLKDLPKDRAGAPIEKSTTKKPPKEVYKVTRDGEGKDSYFVVSPEGKRMHTDPLKKGEAADLKKQLESTKDV